MRTQLEVILPYFLHYANEEQRKRWFPGLADGTLLTAVAMTEPGTGSDLAGMRTTAVRDGDDWIAQRRQDIHHRRHAGRPGDRGGPHLDRSRTTGARA